MTKDRSIYVKEKQEDNSQNESQKATIRSLMERLSLPLFGAGKLSHIHKIVEGLNFHTISSLLYIRYRESMLEYASNVCAYTVYGIYLFRNYKLVLLFSGRACWLSVQ